MDMRQDYEDLSVFEQIKQGLAESLSHARGEMALRTTVVTRPDQPISKVNDDETT